MTKELEKISILTCGSRGDIQPYIAIALSLLKSNPNYSIRILTNSNHASFVKSFNLTHVSIFQDFDDICKNDPSVVEATTTGNTQKFFQVFMKFILEYAESDIKNFFEEVQGNRPDLLLVASYGRYLGQISSRFWGIPVQYVLLQTISYGPKKAPWNLPLIEDEEQRKLMLDKVVGGLYDVWVKLDDVMDNFIRSTGSGKDATKLTSIYSKEQFVAGQYSPSLPLLICQYPLVASILYPEAHPNVHFTGPAIISADDQISSDHVDSFGGNDSECAIREFVEEKEDEIPVYCGWGSMMFVSPEKMILFVVEALMVAKKRGIVLGGWAGLDMDLLRKAVNSDTTKEHFITYAEENILFVKEASHETLFPKVACTIHHGGAGTTNAALRSGKPTIVTPVFMDQFDHAYLVNKLNCGYGFKEQLQSITGEILGRKIMEVCENEDVKKSAVDVGNETKDVSGGDNVASEVKTFWEDLVSTGKFHSVLDEEKNV